MTSFLKKVDRLFAQLALFLISIYQKTLSPDKGIPSLRLKGRVCSHTPHCSAYAKECFERYGFIQGLHYTIERVSTCYPRETKHYDPSVYSVVFFSGAPIGGAFLDGLAQDTRFEITGVVTMPDAARGRGQKIQENIIKQQAKNIGILEDDILTPHSLRLTSKKYKEEAEHITNWLKEKKPDVIVVVAYGKIIPQHILDIPTIGPINVHGSLLPAYRGASPLQSVFLNNEKQTGITIMRMHAELDAGDSIDQKIVPLPFCMTVRELIEVFKEMGPTFLQDTLRSYAKGRLVAIPQDHTKATFTTKITKEDGLVDIFTDTLEDIYATWKAYALRPKTYFVHNDKRISIESLVLDEKTYTTTKEQPCVTRSPDYNLHSAITTFEVKPEGKKKMSWDDFVRGYCK